MYTINENPYLEIQISKKCTGAYKSNIELFLEHKDFSVIKFDLLDDSTNDLITYWIDKFCKKTFLLPIEFSKEIYYRNVLFYNEVALSNKRIELQRCDMCDLIFLNYKGGEKIDSKLMGLISETYSDKKFFLTIRNTEKLTLNRFKYIVEKLTNNEIDIVFNTMYKSTNTIMQHPCNAYMCSGQKCHSNKSKFPRFLYITEKGVMPYMAESKTYRFFEDISLEFYKDISCEFEMYKKSDAYEAFYEANRVIYKDYILPHIFEILPWNYMLDLVSREEK